MVDQRNLAQKISNKFTLIFISGVQPQIVTTWK